MIDRLFVGDLESELYEVLLIRRVLITKVAMICVLHG